MPLSDTVATAIVEHVTLWPASDEKHLLVRTELEPELVDGGADA